MNKEFDDRIALLIGRQVIEMQAMALQLETLRKELEAKKEEASK
jgi:hypothetical protein